MAELNSDHDSQQIKLMESKRKLVLRYVSYGLCSFCAPTLLIWLAGSMSNRRKVEYSVIYLFLVAIGFVPRIYKGMREYNKLKKQMENKNSTRGL